MTDTSTTPGAHRAPEISAEDIARITNGSVQTAAAAFDVNTMTLGEIAQVEELADQAIGDLADPRARKGNLMAGIAWIIQRRTNPSYSFVQAQTLTLGQISALFGTDDEDPKE